ncbi:MAG: nucleotidyltransferase family protein, partial [Mucilaginibacter sp.]
TPKQLLQYMGKTLLQHSIDTAKKASVRSIIVVLGSEMELISSEIASTGLHIVENKDWTTGMASSIRCGINALQSIGPLPDAVILMACDQPFVTSLLLNDLLIVQQATNKPIVCSKYDGTIGIPALFHKSFFHQLLDLKGDSGAKKIMHQNGDSLATVFFSKGSIDIDTLDDYESLSK